MPSRKSVPLFIHEYLTWLSVVTYSSALGLRSVGGALDPAWSPAQIGGEDWPVLARFTYDGLGRLIRTRRYDRQGNAETETYYYDGVRRIRKVCVTTPACAAHQSWRNSGGEA